MVRVSYTFDGPKAAKLALEVALVSLVAETGDNHGLEGIAANVGVLAGFVWRSQSV